MKSILFEICIDSVESALNAVHGGASRLELCGNLGVGGGTTPSLGLFKTVHKAIKPYNIPVMVMIRPRTGDFLYSDADMEVMLEDIRAFKELDVQGFVFGVLTREGRVDVERTRMCVSGWLLKANPTKSYCKQTLRRKLSQKSMLSSGFRHDQRRERGHDRHNEDRGSRSHPDKASGKQRRFTGTESPFSFCAVAKADRYHNRSRL
ncbi:hypothetical protein D9757_004690 [Collybiopsis confluens]|uniref:Copper homeostasis protein cutC homolog n=1 Tax=Collybiopsis confluens TaxID=2823264 RepID=A0A8H5MBM1_9AGAR|nr:hypothetical protein D9757_004690 [Collybiopsis confluens]